MFFFQQANRETRATSSSATVSSMPPDSGRVRADNSCSNRECSGARWSFQIILVPVRHICGRL